MASTVKETYNSTIMTGNVHRLVYDLKENSFWVESGPSTVLLDTKETKEKEERRKRFSTPADEAPTAPTFKLEKSITKKPVSLPRGVSFEDVMTEQGKDPIIEGAAYTHFFPHGLTEQTLIHLKDSSNHRVTLILSTLIGRTQVLDGYIKREDLDAPR